MIESKFDQDHEEQSLIADNLENLLFESLENNPTLPSQLHAYLNMCGIESDWHKLIPEQDSRKE